MKKIKDSPKIILAKILVNILLFIRTFVIMLILMYGGLWIWHFVLKFVLGR